MGLSKSPAPEVEALTSDKGYSPVILTNFRFRRCPSRLTGQPFRLASEDPLPGAQVQPAVGHHDHRSASRTITCNVQPVSVAEVQPVCAAEVQPVCAAEVQPVCAAEVQPVCAAEVQPVCAAEVQPVCAARFRWASAFLSLRSGHSPGQSCGLAQGSGPRDAPRRGLAKRGTATPQASSPVRMCQYCSISRGRNTSSDRPGGICSFVFKSESCSMNVSHVA
jgi:hypothetical protein